MIELQRREIGRFRGAVRRCVAGRPRGLSPPVVMRQTKDDLTLSAVLDDVAISLRLGATGGPAACVALPFTVLANMEGSGAGVVTLEESEPGRVRCRWTDRGEGKELSCESLPTAATHGESAPDTWHTADPALLAALHACGAMTTPTGVRFALAKLQLRGRDGQVVGTDGRQLLLWGGFALPFTDDVLVPAVPVFGGRELTAETAVRIGRTAEHVVVAAGPWTVWLTVDTTARYPDVRSVIPRGTRQARLLIAPEDSASVVRFLEHAEQGPRDAEEPVTLCFGPRPAVRVEPSNAARAAEVRLPRSTCSGPEHTAAIDRRYLSRALSLGLREVRAVAGQTPIHFCDERRSYVVASFDPAPAAASEPARASAGVSAPSIGPSIEEGAYPMTPEKNGQPPVDPTGDLLDPLAEAEALRAALTEAGRRLGRLVAALRQFQKQRRALQTAWTSLKHLQLGAKEEA